MEEQMNMVEVLSEELGAKELKIMKLEVELERTKILLSQAENKFAKATEYLEYNELAYQCSQCNDYCAWGNSYYDKKCEMGRCSVCRCDDTSSEDEGININL